MGRFVGREKVRQMPGAGGIQVAPNPAGNSSELSGIVISTGDQVGAGCDMNSKRVRSLDRLGGILLASVESFIPLPRPGKCRLRQPSGFR